MEKRHEAFFPQAAKMSAMTEIPPLPNRSTDAHKGTFGRVLLIGGSRGMAGSISLSAMAAMRSGAGLGHVAVPDAILETVAAFEPCVMTHPLSCDLDGRLVLTAYEEIAELIAGTLTAGENSSTEGKSAVGIGPGFSRADQSLSLARELVSTVEVPTVVDADALYALSEDLDHLIRSPAARILTPHPGEFSRLIGGPVSADANERRLAAEEFASKYENVVLVLKGTGTVVTAGNRTYVNNTGNPGMATAGSGDVLTGIITALVGQGMDPFEAAVLGVHAHGKAGDLAAYRRGQTGLVASDLVDQLPRVWKRMERSQS